MKKNLALPGNPRYQPKDLVPVFGYDNLAETLVETELAALRTLGKMRVIQPDTMALLTPEVETRLRAITTSEMDKVESDITKHDIRALVRLMQEAMPVPLRRWVHVPLTSYDVFDTARTLQFVRAHERVVRPKMYAVISSFHRQALNTRYIPQIGRTHGQHALPITVGFWFATVLARLLKNAYEMHRYAENLIGKISGAVGAHNAIKGLFPENCRDFEREVLGYLGLKSAPISTQIAPPEPLAYYLYSCLMFSAALGQFGRDARHLMRTEIGEIREPFAPGQVGSSTMAHKRNPANFEQIEGMWLKNKNEFGKVLDTMISEHQRDLVGSSLARDFPIIIVNLVQQMNTLLREDSEHTPFLMRITVDDGVCERNLSLEGDRILAEPLYLALQMYGYKGDAHEFVNHHAIPLVGTKGETTTETERRKTLYGVMELFAEKDREIGDVWEQIPAGARDLFRNPEHYRGDAIRQVEEICISAEYYLNPRGITREML